MQGAVGRRAVLSLLAAATIVACATFAVIVLHISSAGRGDWMTSNTASHMHGLRHTSSPAAQDAPQPAAQGDEIVFATPARATDPNGQPLPAHVLVDAAVHPLAQRLLQQQHSSAQCACAAAARPHVGSWMRGAMYPNASSAAVDAAAHGLSIAVFTQGNTGFHPLTSNWIAMTQRLRPPLPFFVVALDAHEASVLHQADVPVVFSAAHAFAAESASYRQDAYNAMTMHKWRVAMDILKAGVSAFMVDPDIAMLRNPLPYFETLPTCDYITMMEGDSMDGRADEVTSKGGFAQKAYYRTYDNLMNTGYSLFRSTPRMIALLEEFFQYVGAATSGADASKVEDQTLWADFIQDRFFLAGVGPDAALDVRGAAIVDAILHGRCLEYARRSDGASGDIVWTFHPLNPHMFMNRPAHDKRKLQRKILEQPFAVHYNYLVGTDAKVNGMKKNGHYVVL